ncbi:hypothetical protein ACIOEX_01800 [Streptomyces sp. NPDC087850]|uniref:hypothetical protein n=1 Tax=Streptomyces sp. NPDC087850 TaxID=3365809 RepID=UPI0038101CA1
MTTLHRRVDWDGSVREATTMEVDRAEGNAARIRREEGTFDGPGTFPTPARSALLIARAHLGKC